MVTGRKGSVTDTRAPAPFTVTKLVRYAFLNSLMAFDKQRKGNLSNEERDMGWAISRLLIIRSTKQMSVYEENNDAVMESLGLASV